MNFRNGAIYESLEAGESLTDGQICKVIENGVCRSAFGIEKFDDYFTYPIVLIDQVDSFDSNVKKIKRGDHVRCIHISILKK